MLFYVYLYKMDFANVLCVLYILQLHDLLLCKKMTTVSCQVMICTSVMLLTHGEVCG